jgi:hypothetical protein
MTRQSHIRRSELFLVRMWTEETGAGSRLAYGKVQRAVSGETNHFEDWEGLLDRLRAMVADDRRGRQDGAPDGARKE